MRRHTLAILIVATASNVAATVPLEAQQSPTTRDETRQEAGFCFSANPRPSCESYLIFETTGAVRLASTTRRYLGDPRYGPCVAPGCRAADIPSYFAWDIGFMKNRDSRYALGGALQLGGSEDGARVALRARSRIFLPHNGVLDLAAGPMAARVGNGYQPHEAFGGTADVVLGVRHIGGLVFGTDVTDDQSRLAAAVHGGARLESIPAVVASALVAAAGIITLVAIAHGTY